MAWDFVGGSTFNKNTKVVETYDSVADLPSSPDVGSIYIAKDTGDAYFFDGSAYKVLSNSGKEKVKPNIDNVFDSQFTIQKINGNMSINIADIDDGIVYKIIFKADAQINLIGAVFDGEDADDTNTTITRFAEQSVELIKVDNSAVLVR